MLKRKMLRICRRNHRTQCLGHTEGKRQLCPAVLGGLLPLSYSGGHLLRTGCFPTTAAPVTLWRSPAEDGVSPPPLSVPL